MLLSILYVFWGVGHPETREATSSIPHPPSSYICVCVQGDREEGGILVVPEMILLRLIALLIICLPKIRSFFACSAPRCNMTTLRHTKR